jgi:hypothetical protein
LLILPRRWWQMRGDFDALDLKTFHNLSSQHYVPRNMPAIGDLFDLFNFK